MRYVTRGGISAWLGVRRMHSCFVLLRFGSARRIVFELKCEIYSTMGTTRSGARQSGYVPRKVADEFKKRAVQTGKAGSSSKKAQKAKEKGKKKEKKVVSAQWQGACVPPGIRRPWNVFHEDVLYVIEDDKDVSSGSLVTYREELRAVQKLGALRAFQALPDRRQRMYAEVSLLELASFAAWSATSDYATEAERAAAWAGLDADTKADHVPSRRDCRALLAKDPTWHVFIADDMKEKRQPRQEKRPHHRAHQGKPTSGHTTQRKRKSNILLAAGVCAADACATDARAVSGALPAEAVIATGTRGVGRRSTPEAADGDKNLHEPALGQASGVSSAAGTSAKEKRVREDTRGRPQGAHGVRRVDALDAKYPWGREGGPPPASEAEQRSLAEQMARLRIEAGNFGRPERADGKRLAHANTMLDIMRGKARAGFDGGRALAAHGFNLNRSGGFALAKRARKLAFDLEKHFDPQGAPSVLMEEGLALMK